MERPGGLNKARAKRCTTQSEDCECCECTSFNAGADAMLEDLASLVGDDGYITFEKEDGKVVAVYIDD